MKYAIFILIQRSNKSSPYPEVLFSLIDTQHEPVDQIIECTSSRNRTARQSI